MSIAWRIRLIVLIAAVAFALLLSLEVVYGATAGNIKFELTPEGRAVVSCVDGTNPVIRTTPRPKGGYYAVISCEGNLK